MSGIIYALANMDVTNGGNYRIQGTITELGVASRYPVFLFTRVNNLCIRKIWSNDDGSYAFNNIAYRQNGYFVVVFDHGDNPLNAAIADLVTPELMP